MGHNKRWNADEIIRQLSICSSEVNSPFNDGWTSWGCKKDLLTVKYHLDDLLTQAPTFGHLEEEFVEEAEKQKVWKVLNDGNTTKRYK